MPRIKLLSALSRVPLGLAAGALSVGLLGGCVAYPYPYGEAVTTLPSRFDQAWEAALGAAAEAGVQVAAADRASGRISGSKAGAAVSISVQALADGRVQVAFDAPNSRETNPTLGERWLAAYNRRMGR